MKADLDQQIKALGKLAWQRRTQKQFDEAEAARAASERQAQIEKVKPKIASLEQRVDTIVSDLNHRLNEAETDVQISTKQAQLTGLLFAKQYCFHRSSIGVDLTSDILIEVSEDGQTVIKIGEVIGSADRFSADIDAVGDGMLEEALATWLRESRLGS